MTVELLELSNYLAQKPLYLLSRKLVSEGSEHVDLILDTKLCSALFIDALLPSQVLIVEN